MSKIRNLVLICAALYAGGAHAQRVVVVNGIRMTNVQVMRLDQLQCAHVPNGNYWLNLRTGAWGYAGSPVRQGFVGDACRAGRPPSLSQRGRLYRPGEILNGR